MSQEANQSSQATSTSTETMPTIEQLAEGIDNPLKVGEETPPAAPAERPAIDRLDDFERQSSNERDIYRMKEEFRKERDQMKRDREEHAKRFGNIESVVDEFMGTDPENQPDQEGFDPEQYKRELREDILNDVKGYQNETEEQKQMDLEVNNFKGEITSFLDEKGADFPLAHGMKQGDLIFEIIENQYQKDAKEFGYEYADKSILSQEDAARQAENHLASQIDEVLQSEHMRGYLLQRINESRATAPHQGVENQSNMVNESRQPQTLTNNMTQESGNSQHVNEINMTEDERFSRALSMVK